MAPTSVTSVGDVIGDGTVFVPIVIAIRIGDLPHKTAALQTESKRGKWWSIGKTKTTGKDFFFFLFPEKYLSNKRACYIRVVGMAPFLSYLQGSVRLRRKREALERRRDPLGRRVLVWPARFRCCNRPNTWSCLPPSFNKKKKLKEKERERKGKKMK